MNQYLAILTFLALVIVLFLCWFLYISNSPNMSAEALRKIVRLNVDYAKKLNYRANYSGFSNFRSVGLDLPDRKAWATISISDRYNNLVTPSSVSIDAALTEHYPAPVLPYKLLSKDTEIFCGKEFSYCCGRQWQNNEKKQSVSFLWAQYSGNFSNNAPKTCNIIISSVLDMSEKDLLGEFCSFCDNIESFEFD
jgi:hypothetical protein